MLRPQPADLARIPIFASLSPDELATVSGWLEVRSASAGTELVGEGAAGYCFFVLQSGAAVVTHGGEELTTLGAGDFFGELAILGDGRRSASVTATEPVTLYAMFGTEFRRLEQELPGAAEQVKRAVNARLACSAS